MAATQYKLTMVFNQGRQGWTESFYASAGTLAKAVDDCTALGAKRGAMLGGGCVIDGLRIQFPLVRGSTRLIAVPPRADPGIAAARHPWTAILLSIRAIGVADGDATSVYRRNFELRGFPQDAVSGVMDTNQEHLSAAFTTALNEYFAQLKAMGASIKGNTKGTDSTAITAVAAGDNITTLTAAGAHGLVAGDKVLLAGFSYGWKILNGRTIVQSANGLSIVVPKISGAGVFFPPAYIQKQGGSFPTITDYTFLRTVTKDTGHSFFATRGRYKKRSINT
jgi:hypothetical protein